MNMLRKSIIALLLVSAAQSGIFSVHVFAASSSAQQTGMDGEMWDSASLHLAQRIDALNEENARAGRKVYIDRAKKLIFVNGQSTKQFSNKAYLEEDVTAQEVALAAHQAKEAKRQRECEAEYDAKDAAMTPRERLLRDINTYNFLEVRDRLGMGMESIQDLMRNKATPIADLEALLAKLKDAYDAVHFHEKLITDYSNAHSRFLIERIVADRSECFNGRVEDSDFVRDLARYERAELVTCQKRWAHEVLVQRNIAEKRVREAALERQRDELLQQIRVLDPVVADAARKFIADNSMHNQRFCHSINAEIEYLEKVLQVAEEQARVRVALIAAIDELSNVPMDLDSMDEAALRDLLEQKKGEAVQEEARRIAEQAERERQEALLAQREQEQREAALREQAEEAERREIARHQAVEREAAKQEMIKKIHEVLVRLGAMHAVVQLNLDAKSVDEVAEIHAKAIERLAEHNEYVSLRDEVNAAAAEVARLEKQRDERIDVLVERMVQQDGSSSVVNGDKKIAEAAAKTVLHDIVKNNNVAKRDHEVSRLTAAIDAGKKFIAQGVEALVSFARRHPLLTAGAVTVATFPTAAAAGSILFPGAVDVLASAAAQCAVLAGGITGLSLSCMGRPGTPVVDGDAESIDGEEAIDDIEMGDASGSGSGSK